MFALNINNPLKALVKNFNRKVEAIVLHFLFAYVLFFFFEHIFSSVLFY